MAWCGGGQGKTAQERGWVRVKEGQYRARDRLLWDGAVVAEHRTGTRARARARARAHPRASLGLGWPCPMASGAAAAPGSTHAKGS
eukprot:scaffold29127_cov78-Phaeocystis_antarctica.AAC.1